MSYKFLATSVPQDRHHSTQGSAHPGAVSPPKTPLSPESPCAASSPFSDAELPTPTPSCGVVLLLSLPPVIVVTIMRLLKIEDLGRVARTCKRLKILAYSNDVMESVLRRIQVWIRIDLDPRFARTLAPRLGETPKAQQGNSMAVVKNPAADDLEPYSHTPPESSDEAAPVGDASESGWITFLPVPKSSPLFFTCLTWKSMLAAFTKTGVLRVSPRLSRSTSLYSKRIALKLVRFIYLEVVKPSYDMIRSPVLPFHMGLQLARSIAVVKAFASGKVITGHERMLKRAKEAEKKFERRVFENFEIALGSKNKSSLAENAEILLFLNGGKSASVLFTTEMLQQANRALAGRDLSLSRRLENVVMNLRSGCSDMRDVFGDYWSTIAATVVKVVFDESVRGFIRTEFDRTSTSKEYYGFMLGIIELPKLRSGSSWVDKVWRNRLRRVLWERRKEYQRLETSWLDRECADITGKWSRSLEQDADADGEAADSLARQDRHGEHRGDGDSPFGGLQSEMGAWREFLLGAVRSVVIRGTATSTQYTLQKTSGNRALALNPTSGSTRSLSSNGSRDFTPFKTFISTDVAISVIELTHAAILRLVAFLEFTLFSQASFDKHQESQRIQNRVSRTVLPGWKLRGWHIETFLEPVILALIKFVGDRHIIPGFRRAVAKLASYKPRSTVEENKFPLYEFFELIQTADVMTQMVHVYFVESWSPFVDLNDPFVRSSRERKKLEATIDNYVVKGLERSVEVMMRQVEFTLEVEQDPTDYWKDENLHGAISDLKTSSSCVQVIGVMREHARIIRCLPPGNKDMIDVLLSELSVRLFHLIIRHLKATTVSKTGGVQLLCDINAYSQFVSSHLSASEDVATHFRALKNLCHIYIVKPDSGQLRELLVDPERYGNVFTLEEVREEFLSRREDYNKLKDRVRERECGIM